MSNDAFLPRQIGYDSRLLGFVRSEYMLEWAIQSRGRTCAITGNTFADKEPCHTVLLQLHSGYERLDLCQAAWDAEGAALAARPNLVSHWRGEYHAPVAAPPEAIGKDDAEGLLRRILEFRDETYAAAAFVLAAMLERKRLLKVRSEVREGDRRIFVYEHSRTGDILAVADPNLHLDQLLSVQRQVADLLTNGLPPAAVAPAPLEPTDPTETPVAPSSAQEAGPPAVPDGQGLTLVETIA